MSKTLAEVKDWLKTQDKIVTVLATITNVGGAPSPTFYLSNLPYIGTSVIYDACLVGGLSFSQSISFDGSASISYGDLEIENTDGSRDTWLTYIWANKNITISIGDPRWVETDFYPVFYGVVSDLVTRDRSKLSLVLLDKLEKLNTSISETTLENLGYTESNKTSNSPLIFGECFNVEPVRTNAVPNNLEYIVHTKGLLSSVHSKGAIEDIIEVRDNGLPVLFTKNNATGTFTLVRSPFGKITASVQGDKTSGTYTNTIGGIIKNIVKNYGVEANRFTDGDIHASVTNNTTPVGIYITGRDNLLEVCNTLAASTGHSLYIDTLSKLRLVRLDMAGNGNTPHVVTNDDIVWGSLYLSESSQVSGSCNIGYCKNWSVHESSSLAGAVPQAHVPLFTEEWLNARVSDSTTLSTYSQSSEPSESIDTMLLTSTDASTEANRRLSLWKIPRYIVTFTAYAHLLDAELGDNITVYNSRFGLSAGKSGIIVNISRDWTAGRITMGVLV